MSKQVVQEIIKEAWTSIAGMLLSNEQTGQALSNKIHELLNERKVFGAVGVIPGPSGYDFKVVYKNGSNPTWDHECNCTRENFTPTEE